MNEYLITGTKNGLGKYLVSQLEDVYCVDSKEDEIYDDFHDFLSFGNYHSRTHAKCDTLIHCARSHICNNPTPKDVAWYIHYNTMLTEYLLKFIDYNRFVFISSADCYNYNNPYTAMKIRCEDEILNYVDGYSALILRCATICHEFMHENSIIKLLRNKDVTVTPDSTFNLVDGKSILDFIRTKPNHTVCPIIAEGVIKARDINPNFTANYGRYHYYCGDFEKRPVHSYRYADVTTQDVLDYVKGFVNA